MLITVYTGIKDCEYTTEQIRVMLGENERSSVPNFDLITLHCHHF